MTAQGWPQEPLRGDLRAEQVFAGIPGTPRHGREALRVTSEPTYRDVAEWLPTDIREHIEATLPCRVHGQHRWHYTRGEIRKWGQLEPAAVIESWECPCGLVHTTDPEKRA